MEFKIEMFMSSYYREQLENWLHSLNIVAGKVLDIGGSQLPVLERVNYWDVEKYDILDLEQPHKTKRQPDIICDINSSENYFSIFEKRQSMYDIVFCLEVMEYVYHPNAVLTKIATVLKNGGSLYITFPTFYPVHEPREQDYLRYTRQGAIKMLESAGFSIEQILPRTMKEASLRQVYSAEKMRAAKGYDGHEDVGYIIHAKKL